MRPHPIILQNMSFRILCTFTCLTTACIAYGEELAPDANVALNDCFASVHDTWRGDEACEAAITHARTDAGHAQATASLAMIKVREGNLPAARELMNQALGSAPNDSMVMTNHGSLLLREREFAAAVVAYDTVLAQQFDKPTDATLRPALYLNRSLALRALGRYDEAAQDFAAYLQYATPAPEPTESLPQPIPDTPAALEY